MDQAQKLREIIGKVQGGQNKSLAPVEKSDARIITVSSGKGGVGKTNFTVNLALALGALGNRVTIIDADLGLANVDVVMGIVPKYTLRNVIREEKSLDEIIAQGPHGIQVISGGSGMMDLVDMEEAQIEKLIESFKVLNDRSDYILIDTGAGLSKSVLSFIQAADDVVMVVTPDPTSITDAYAVIKNISGLRDHIKVVVNRVETNKEGESVFNKINMAAKKFLDVELLNIGYIYEDHNVKKAVRTQKPFFVAYPHSLASKGIDLIAYNIDKNTQNVQITGGFNRFINRLFKSF